MFVQYKVRMDKTMSRTKVRMTKLKSTYSIKHEWIKVRQGQKYVSKNASKKYVGIGALLSTHGQKYVKDKGTYRKSAYSIKDVWTRVRQGPKYVSQKYVEYKVRME